MKYFVFNKPMDYERGYIENCICTSNGIQLSKGYKKGVFFSKILDSGEKETHWHRMTCVMPEFRAGIRFWIYSSETTDVIYNGQKINIEEILFSNISPSKKRSICECFLKKEVLGETDILLHNVKGRYIWICIEIYSGQEDNAGVENIFIYFPQKSWINYLPSIYQKNRESAEFLDRYLSIFQTLYDDFNNKFENSAVLLEPSATNIDFLHYMAKWLDMSNTHIWSEEKLRKLIHMAPNLFKKCGTRSGIIEIIKLFTGEEPLIVEQWQIRQYLKNSHKKEALERLYGTDENTFLILIKEKYCSGKREQEALLNIIQEMSPAHMEARLVSLRQFIILGEHTYLGVNSSLGYYKPMRLDGFSLVSLTSVGKNE